MLLVLARLQNQAIERFEIEAAFFGLHQFPGYRRKNGVEVQLLEQRPVLLHARKVRRGGIAEFSAQYQEWLALHQQLSGFALVAQLWNGSLSRLRDSACQTQQ